MTKKRAEKISLQVVDWCSKEFGWSKYYHRHTVMIESQYQCDTGKGTYGEFDRDEVMIYVFTRTNRTVKCLVNTVIHEFQHYLQSPHWIGRYIAKYGDGQRNPYEREAEMVAGIYTKLCMKDLKLK